MLARRLDTNNQAVLAGVHDAKHNVPALGATDPADDWAAALLCRHAEPRLANVFTAAQRPPLPRNSASRRGVHTPNA